MPGLTAVDPLRVATLLRLASLELATGNPDAARSAYAATGLSSQQCALLDPGPAKARAGVSGLDFPAEAQQWGFEGFAVIEHDVLASGNVANVRATVAYPPFVFSPGSVEGVERFRYDPSYRPDGSISCGGKSTRIAFRLPD
jgi:hypothetical protein